MTQDQEIKKIPLEVGKTQIGSMMGKFKGEVYNFQIYYGNYILPSPHGEFIHYNQNLYKQKLMKFLDSEEGQKYIRPTEKEIEEATQLVISKESQLISKQTQYQVDALQTYSPPAEKYAQVHPDEPQYLQKHQNQQHFSQFHLKSFLLQGLPYLKYLF